MSDFAARVRRVRMKSGGADVCVLSAPPKLNELSEALLQTARHIVTEQDENSTLEGYAVIALYADGQKNLCYDLTGNHGVPVELLPAYMSELMRRVSVQRIASATFDSMFEYAE